jgi:hypothetical protein
VAPLFCGASNDEDFDQVAECRRRHGHQAHHCDTTKQLAWDENGPVECPALYDHGAPPNRATRRATTTRRPRHLARIRRNDGRNV